MKHILLTGGAGYIGSHTAYALKKAGYMPVVLDNMSSGHEWAVKYGPFVQGDIGDQELVKRLCDEYKPEAMIHLAALINSAKSVENPQNFWENNHIKAVRLFQAVSEWGIEHTVFSSTAAVYGQPDHDTPINENLPLIPINPYGETKLAAEEALRAQPNMNSVCLRYFNASGAAPAEEEIGCSQLPERFLLPTAILASLGLIPHIRVFGTDYPTYDGTAIRDYIHVLDLAEAHVATLQYLLGGGGTDVFNLGTGQGSSVQEVIAMVEEVSGKEIEQIEEAPRSGDPSFLVSDPTRAKERLGWKPRYDLHDIVSSAYAWQQSKTYLAERQKVLDK